MAFVLESCVWEITLACCFSCRYCGSKGGKAREDELTTQECLNIADQLAEIGCRRVSLIGGEVFMRPDWDRIVSRLTGQGVRVPIITNGYLFDEDMIRRMKRAGVESVAVSIDATEEIHDRYRQKGSYQRALKAVDVLTEAGIPVSVISTLNAENVSELDKLYAVLSSRPISAWQLQACSPMGNAARYGVKYQFHPLKVIDFIRRIRDTAPFPVGMADNLGYYTEDDNRLRGNRYGGDWFSGCRAGLTAIGIDSIGRVRGCESMEEDCFVEGSLREKTLREIWEDPDAFAYNRKFTPSLLTGPCSDCSMGPYCAGGCRSYNYFVHGKMYEYPACARTFHAGGGSAPDSPGTER